MPATRPIITRANLAVAVEMAIADTSGLTSDEVARLRHVARTATSIGANLYTAPGCPLAQAGMHEHAQAAAFGAVYDETLHYYLIDEFDVADVVG
jgi:hypothetical protein